MKSQLVSTMCNNADNLVNTHAILIELSQTILINIYIFFNATQKLLTIQYFTVYTPYID